MAKKKTKRDLDEENKPMKADMTPMIDVTFQLLIFFMLTIKFKTLEGKLAAYLPKDVGVNTTQAEPKEKIEIKIKVVAEGIKMVPDGTQAWDGRGAFKYKDRKLAYSIGPRTTREVDVLASRLKELHRADPEQPVSIDPYPGTIYEDVVTVLDKAIQANFKDITFIGDRSGAVKK